MDDFSISLIKLYVKGSGRCYLCKSNGESNFHLGVECPYTKWVWKEIESKIHLNNLWNGELVETCLRNWCLNKDINGVRSLPLIVLWFIWKAKNQSCFDDTLPQSSQIFAIYLGMLRYIPQGFISIKTRHVVVESIDFSFPWGYFDGSTAGDPKVCGAGGILFFHFF